jgi:hypothetical protein
MFGTIVYLLGSVPISDPPPSSLLRLHRAPLHLPSGGRARGSAVQERAWTSASPYSTPMACLLRPKGCRHHRRPAHPIIIIEEVDEHRGRADEPREADEAEGTIVEAEWIRPREQSSRQSGPRQRLALVKRIRSQKWVGSCLPLAVCFANAALSSWEEAYSLGALLLLFVEKLT